MKGSIRLHPEHGVNPTVSQCFFCGKDKNEIALLGAAYKGEAPRHMVLSYEPCDTCKEIQAKGITLIEARDYPEPHNQPPIQKEPVTMYPTGSWAVITERLVRNAINPPSLAEDIIKKRVAFVEPGILKALGLEEIPDAKH